MKPKRFNFDPANVDPDGLADGVVSSQADVLITGALINGADLDGLAAANSSAGTTVILDGDLTANGIYVDSTGHARYIYILDEGTDDQSGATYTITGTDANNSVLVESLIGPVADAYVLSVNRFKTITEITIASPVATSTVDIGVNGVYISVDGLAHRLDFIDTGADVQTGATYTIVGSDADSREQTESRAGPGSGATVESTKYFLTVTSVTISSPVATSTIDIGTVDEIATKTIPLDFYRQAAPLVSLNVTGTISIDIQLTNDDPWDPDTFADQNSYLWIDDDSLAAVTANAHGTLSDWPVRSIRFITNSYTSGAEFQATLTQSFANSAL